MNISKAILLVTVPAAVTLATPVTAHAAPNPCADMNTYFPTATGYWFIYQYPPVGSRPAQQMKVTFKAPVGNKILIDVANVTPPIPTPPPPTANGEITCVSGGFVFDWASAFQGTTGVTISKIIGTTFPAPDKFVLSTPPAPPSSWSDTVELVAQQGPYSVTMEVKQLYTIDGQSNMPWPAIGLPPTTPTWHVSVARSTRILRSTVPGMGSGAPNISSSSEEWIVNGVGVVKAGSPGKYMEMIAHK